MAATRILAIFTAVLLTSVLVSVLGSVGGTGIVEQQPTLGFFEDGITILIMDSSGSASTTFSRGEDLTVTITSDFVDLSAGEKKNELLILDATGNEEVGESFTQTSFSVPYSYSGTIKVPNAPAYYVLEVRLEQDNQAKDEVRLFEMIAVQVGPQPPAKAGAIETFADGWARSSSAFGPTQRIFIEVETGGVIPDARNSRISLRDYLGERDRIDMVDLEDGQLVMVGNSYRLIYDLAVDLDPSKLKAGSLDSNGAWYDLVLDLKDSADNDILADWGMQVFIRAPSMTMVAGSTAAAPSPVTREGTDTTTLSASFSIPSAPAISALEVDFMVRDQSDREVIVIADGYHGDSGPTGGQLTITSPSSGEYLATIPWDPDNADAVGSYDLGFTVSQAGTEVLRDPFDANRNELDVISSASPPTLATEGPQVIPSSLDLAGTITTQISVQFTDAATSILGDFSVTFSLRAADGTQTILVDALQVGQTGLFGQPLMITGSSGVFLASYSFDPQAPLIAGIHDLSATVTNANGLSATDGYGANRDELRLLASGAAPVVTAGDTRAIPSIVDRASGVSVVISTQFTDDDAPAATDFSVSYTLRTGPTETILVAAAADGTTGIFGGTLAIIASAPGIYVASYSFTPTTSMDLGKYDLSFQVVDAAGNSASDPFSNNRNGLELVSSSDPPTFNEGASQAVPTVVAADGTVPVTMSLEFQDADGGLPGDYLVTFELVSATDTLTLITAGSDGDTGLDGGTLQVTSPTSGTYLATYTWTPTADTPSGDYALRSTITDDSGLSLEDPASANPGALEIQAADPTSSDGSEFPWLLVLLALALLALLVLLAGAGLIWFLVSRGKQGDEDEPEASADAESAGAPEAPTEAVSDDALEVEPSTSPEAAATTDIPPPPPPEG